MKSLAVDNASDHTDKYNAAHFIIWSDGGGILNILEKSHEVTCFMSGFALLRVYMIAYNLGIRGSWQEKHISHNVS